MNPTLSCSRKTAVMVSLFLILPALCSCSLSGSKTATLKIQTGEETNGGKVCYLLVRSVEDRAFLLETYHEVARLVFDQPHTPNLLANFMVIPGENRQVEVPRPGKNGLAVYCLYSDPGKQWKVLLPAPLKKKYTIHLEKDEIRLK